MMEFTMFDTERAVLITPQAIDAAAETEHRLAERSPVSERPLQPTVTIYTRHGEIVVLDPDRTVMAQIKAGDGARLELALHRAEIDLAYERQERKAAECAVAPLKAYVEQLSYLNDGLSHDVEELLAGDGALEAVRTACAWAALWKRAAKRHFVPAAHRIFANGEA